MSSTPEARCSSCGTPYSEHLGLTGTCRLLADALAELRAYRPARALAAPRLPEHGQLAATIHAEVPEPGREGHTLCGLPGLRHHAPELTDAGDRAVTCRSCLRAIARARRDP